MVSQSCMYQSETAYINTDNDYTYYCIVAIGSNDYNNSMWILQAVEPDHSPTTEATLHPSNTNKNRYANISACKLLHSIHLLVTIATIV